MKICYWLLACLILLASQPAFALRCGHYLVEEGDYKADVIDKCGDPDSTESHYERRGNVNRGDATVYSYNGNRQFPQSSFNLGRQNYQEIEVLVEEWVYDFGSSRLRKLLRFENGRLKDIESLGRRR